MLLMSDRIDEWMAGYLTEYAGKKLRHIGKGEIELDSSDAEAHKATEEAASGVVAKLKDLLGDRETDAGRSKDLALLLLEQAQVAEGAQLDDPAAFVQRLNRVILETGAGYQVAKDAGAV